MLRSMDENQGIGIYTRNVIPKLLRLDGANDYVLIYRDSAHVGRFAQFANATEVVLRLPTKLLWDQVGVPWLARERGIDLIFNTKFTVPLHTGCRTIMMLHGSDWFTHPEHYHPLDIAYIRRFMPRYCKAADHLISNSELTTNDFVELLGVPREKITTIHLAANECFAPVLDEKVKERVRRRYGLPQRFMLSVTKYFPGKNVPTLIRAFDRVALARSAGIQLVLFGQGVERYLDDLGLRGTELADCILTPGWVSQEDLPAIYSMAELFAFPSRYESFGIPVLEAMACGCPVVTSNDGAMPEIASGAAELVDPYDVDSVANGIARLLEDRAWRRELVQRGLARARQFSWEEHARRTIEVFRNCRGTAT